MQRMSFMMISVICEETSLPTKRYNGPVIEYSRKRNYFYGAKKYTVKKKNVRVKKTGFEKKMRFDRKVDDDVKALYYLVEKERKQKKIIVSKNRMKQMSRFPYQVIRVARNCNYSIFI